MAAILVVEDDADIRELIAFNLEAQGYHVDRSAHGLEALQMAQEDSYDLILLDQMLPGLEGTEVCARLRQDPRRGDTPIILLTARSGEGEVVAGLQAGADDYITKPFSPRVLMARVEAALRRGGRYPSLKTQDIKVGRISIQIRQHRVSLPDREVKLSPTEFAILSFLASQPDWVFRREQIINAVKGEDYPVTGRSIDVQILSLRRKLGPEGKKIETVRGVGYRLRSP